MAKAFHFGLACWSIFKRSWQKNEIKEKTSDRAETKKNGAKQWKNGNSLSLALKDYGSGVSETALFDWIVLEEKDGGI